MSAPKALLRVSRVFCRSCIITRATRMACLSSRVLVPSRQLTTSSKVQQETTETQLQGKELSLTATTPEPPESNARSITITRLPKQAVKSEIEEFLKSEGFEITKMQLRLDRFTLQNDQRCSVELTSQEQAREAIQTLNGVQFLNRQIVVKPLRKDFVWGSIGDRAPGPSNRFFHLQEVSPFEALKPLLEGRRKFLSVEAPGWVGSDPSVRHSKIAEHHVQTHLGKFGIEAISRLERFHGPKSMLPRMACYIDFTTNSGADQAVQTIHNTTIEDRNVWLSQPYLAPWRAYQVGKVDQTLLSELQEKGLASTEPCADNSMLLGRTWAAKY